MDELDLPSGIVEWTRPAIQKRPWASNEPLTEKPGIWVAGLTRSPWHLF
jgi:hypothetical protein